MNDMEAGRKEEGLQEETSPLTTTTTPPATEPIPALETKARAPEVEPVLLANLARGVVEKALESGVQEAASINTLLASTVDEVLSIAQSRAPEPEPEFSLEDERESEVRSVNSSLGLSAADKLSSSDRVPSSSLEAETSSSSGIDYEEEESSSEGRGQSLDSMHGKENDYNLLDEEEEEERTQELGPRSPGPLDLIEDLYDQPPPFIPPPPTTQASPPLGGTHKTLLTSQPDPERETYINGSTSESERDSYSQTPPRVIVTGKGKCMELSQA
jgi:hypothetical protein